MRPVCTSRAAQRGQSLISMMVGLVISLLTIGAMLAIYKISIGISTNASQTALRDGQVSAALLAAQIELQQAGYGIEADAADILSISAGGRQVVWRYRSEIGGPSKCAGLRLIASGAGDVAGVRGDSDLRGLYWLPGKPCESLTPEPTWNDSPRHRPTLLASPAAFYEPADMQGTPLDDEDGAVALTGLRFVRVSGGACLPYLQQTDGDDIPTRSQRVALRDASSQDVFSVCLPNVQGPADPEKA
jgi:hypothetical protein